MAPYSSGENFFATAIIRSFAVFSASSLYFIQIFVIPVVLLMPPAAIRVQLRCRFPMTLSAEGTQPDILGPSAMPRQHRGWAICQARATPDRDFAQEVQRLRGDLLL